MKDYLMRELFDNFPRIHTAIAEIIACILFILPAEKRLKGWKLYGGFAAFGVLLFFANYYNEQVTGVFWFLLMGACMAEMFFMIWLCCEMTVWKALYIWAHAFIVSEFAASLEWQINCYVIYEVRKISPGEFYYALSAVYLVVFALVWLVNRKTEWVNYTIRTTPRDGIITAVVAVLMFLIGCFRFLFPNSFVAEATGVGILFIRTLADFAGVLLIYAIDVQRQELNVRYELGAMDAILKRQYEQFQVARANDETLRRMYHDLKHQIAFIQNEDDERKKADYLLEMKQIISNHEAEVHTGNTVLDTLLTGKNLQCLDSGISLTVFADARDISFMDTMDICSRLIKLTVRTQNRFLLIRVDNFCKEIIELKDGLIDTSKEDREAHGFGLKSIRRTAEKYGGMFSIEQKGNWFSLVVLIPIPRTG